MLPTVLRWGVGGVMRLFRGLEVVTVSVAAVVLAQAAPSHAASTTRLTCFGKAATIVGTPGPDILGGGPEDVVLGLGGDDQLAGGTVCGGAGNDSINGKTGEGSSLDGGEGDDTLRGDAGRYDVLLGGPGNDYVADENDLDYADWTDPGTDVLKGGPGDDLVVSASGRNLAYGDGGADRIYDYTRVGTVVSGGPGNDRMVSTGDNYGDNPVELDRVAGDAGRDTAAVNRIDKVSSTESVTYVD